MEEWDASEDEESEEENEELDEEKVEKKKKQKRELLHIQLKTYLVLQVVPLMFEKLNFIIIYIYYKKILF